MGTSEGENSESSNIKSTSNMPSSCSSSSSTVPSAPAPSLPCIPENLGPLEAFLNFFSSAIEESNNDEPNNQPHIEDIAEAEVNFVNIIKTDQEAKPDSPKEDFKELPHSYQDFFYDTVDTPIPDLISVEYSSDEEDGDTDQEPSEEEQESSPTSGRSARVMLVSSCPCKLCKTGYNDSKKPWQECHECLYEGCRRMFLRRNNLYKPMADRTQHPLVCPGQQCDKRFRKTEMMVRHLDKKRHDRNNKSGKRRRRGRKNRLAL